MIIWLQDEIKNEGTDVLDDEHLKLIQRAGEMCLETEGFPSSAAEDLAVGLSLVDEDEIKDLNGQFRQIHEVTDVLSFPMMEYVDEIRKAAESDHGDIAIPLGDVVICLNRVRQQAAEYGHSETRELIYLFVHSMLHLMGYDHMEDDDKREMRAREEKIMKKMGIER